MDDEALWSGFRERSLTQTAWNHHAHVRVAWMHLASWPAVDDAHLRIRAGIIRLNAAHGLEETPERGYHETLTRVWIATVAALRKLDAKGDSRAFVEHHAPALGKEAPLRHYTRERLFSLEARAVFVAPDVAPLP
jgi:hypothetical protein